MSLKGLHNKRAKFKNAILEFENLNKEMWWVHNVTHK
jgi:hypothetical protein